MILVCIIEEIKKMKQVKKTTFITLLTALIITLSSCNEGKWPCVNGKGESVSQLRLISGFTGVSSSIEGSIYVSQGSEFEVRIEAQQNVLDQIRTEISGNDLEIYSEHCINNSNPVNIFITMPSISSLELDGSGSFITQNKISSADLEIEISGSGNFSSNDTILAPELSMDVSGSGNINLLASTPLLSADISGSGDITISGSGTSLDLEISGSGKFQTFNFYTLSSQIQISGSGDIELNVENEIEGSLSGSGDLYYKNSPILNVSVSGSGQIIHVD